ncbi:uncharacterized protein [Penaeus vannamei]|uniref:uncharacterized protein n=1 Tax=Penaeus vannamei TaxID=6689 RepID=UPI00387FA1A8
MKYEKHQMKQRKPRAPPPKDTKRPKSQNVDQISKQSYDRDKREFDRRYGHQYNQPAAVITEVKGIKLKEMKKGKRKQPAWKEKIEKEMAQKRSDLSILTEIANDVNVNERKKRNISRRYKIKKPEEIAVIRELKQQIQAKAQRIRFEKRSKQFK